MVFFAVLFSLAAGVLIRQTRLGMVRWKPAAGVAAVVACLEGLHVLNSLREILFHYDSQEEMRVFVLRTSVELIMMVIGVALTAALASGLILACFPDAPSILRPEARALWGRDAVVATLAALGGTMTLQGIGGQLHYRASSLALAPTLSLAPNLETYVPVFSVLRDAVLLSLLYGATLGFGAYLWSRILTRNWQRFALVAALLASGLPGSARRFSEAGLDLLVTLVLLGLGYWIIMAFFRDNYLAYVIVPAILALFRAAAAFHGQGNTTLELQAWLLWAIALGVAIILMKGNRATGTQ
jgi:hypothetical protein